MKYGLHILSILLLTAFSLAVNAQSATNDKAYKSVDDEVSLQVYRGSGEVKLLIQVKDITQYHHIVIERSAENLNYFGKCKYIAVENLKVTDGKITEADKYPYSATKNVYYRIKTVSNDGVERAYPDVLLPPIAQ